ncbi:MAG TPA: hypothetical protein VN364_04270 [Bellilinea sp.]|nr:hypothetical protein [Bellilinea sp.]
MSKKQKRSVSTHSPKVETPLKSAVAAPSRSSGSGEFNPDYGYVIKDLKRIGVLAGSFFVLLIALAIFLR